MDDVLDILDFISNNLNGYAKVKMNSCLHKNTGLGAIIMLYMDLYYGGCLSYAPLVSAAVERNISQYKYILTCRGRTLTLQI